jgi:RecA-family ATPase
MSAATIIDAESTELPENLAAELDSCRRLVAAARKDPASALQRGAACVFRAVTQDTPDLFRAAVDELYNIAIGAGMTNDDETQEILDNAVTDAWTLPGANDPPLPEPTAPQANGHDTAPVPQPDAYGTTTAKLPATIDDISAIIPAKFITPAAWPNEAPPPVDWLVAGFIQRGDVTTLHGDGGAGKTDIALRLAANVERGAAEWLGLELTPTANGPVVFISAEDPERKVRRRLWHHAKHDGYDLNAVTNLHLWFPAKMSGTVLAVPDRYTGTMKPTAAFQSLAAAIVDLRPVLVITDNVAATYGGNQNDRAQVRSFVNLWADIAEGPSRPAVLLLDHPSLSGLTNNTGRGGNMDWRNAVRSALHLYAPADKAEADRGIRILETTKINEGKPGNPVRLVWAEGGLQLEHAPSSHHRASKERECEEIFLRFLDERNAQGSHVGRRTSGMYAPKVFAAASDNGGYTKSAFAAAMERLFTAGTIREVWDQKRRHDYIDRGGASV